MIAEIMLAAIVLAMPVPDQSQSAGTYRITYYCQACNTPAGSTATSTGRWQPGYSVATPDFEPGTILEIGGREYRVDDTGCQSGTVDILRETAPDGSCICDQGEVTYQNVYVKGEL